MRRKVHPLSRQGRRSSGGGAIAEGPGLSWWWQERGGLASACVAGWGLLSAEGREGLLRGAPVPRAPASPAGMESEAHDTLGREGGAVRPVCTDGSFTQVSIVSLCWAFFLLFLLFRRAGSTCQAWATWGPHWPREEPRPGGCLLAPPQPSAPRHSQVQGLGPWGPHSACAVNRGNFGLSGHHLPLTAPLGSKPPTLAMAPSGPLAPPSPQPLPGAPFSLLSTLPSPQHQPLPAVSPLPRVTGSLQSPRGDARTCPGQSIQDLAHGWTWGAQGPPGPWSCAVPMQNPGTPLSQGPPQQPYLTSFLKPRPLRLPAVPQEGGPLSGLSRPHTGPLQPQALPLQGQQQVRLGCQDSSGALCLQRPQGVNTRQAKAGRSGLTACPPTDRPTHPGPAAPATRPPSSPRRPSLQAHPHVGGLPPQAPRGQRWLRPRSGPPLLASWAALRLPGAVGAREPCLDTSGSAGRAWGSGRAGAVKPN